MCQAAPALNKSPKLRKPAPFGRTGRLTTALLSVQYRATKQNPVSACPDFFLARLVKSKKRKFLFGDDLSK
jgi:hypothetical protein